MNRTLRAAAAAIALTAMPSPAHHAFSAEYDANRCVTISGTATRIEWSNPHVWLSVEASDELGQPIKWSIEMGSPGGLLRRGWSKTALREGDHVVVEGYGAKDGRKVLNARTVTLPDGRKLFGGFQSTPGAPVRR
jgi:hypothetical protein